jgi:hypothetical protein
MDRRPQQVLPVVSAACARQKIHGAACQGFPIGYAVVETLRATSLPLHLFVVFVVFVVPARTFASLRLCARPCPDFPNRVPHPRLFPGQMDRCITHQQADGRQDAHRYTESRNKHKKKLHTDNASTLDAPTSGKICKRQSHNRAK